MSFEDFCEKIFLRQSLVTLFMITVFAGCEISPWAGTGSRRSTVSESRDDDGVQGAKDKDESEDSQSGQLEAVRDEDEEAGRVGGIGMRGVPAASGAKRELRLNTGATEEGVPWIGGRDAAVRIEVFSDFACPFCRVGAQVVHLLLEKYGEKIKVLYYQTPIPSLYADSFSASQASLAAQAQGKFWPMHDLLYENPRAHSSEDLIGYAKRLGLDVKKFEQELTAGTYAKRVRREMALGAKRGIEGTPTFFVNGRKIEGAAPLETFQKLIDGLLRESESP